MQPTPKKIYFTHRDRETGKLMPMWKFVTPIKKMSTKYFNRISVTEWKEKQELKQLDSMKGLELIYHKYFKHHNFSQIYSTLSYYSTIDNFISSGRTDIPLEFKTHEFPVYKYNDSLIEKSKYDRMIELCGLLKVRNALYVVEYTDGVVLGWLVNKDSNIKWSVQECQKNNSDPEMIDKAVGFLNYRNADLILSKKTWRAVKFDVLNNYINKKRDQQ